MPAQFLARVYRTESAKLVEEWGVTHNKAGELRVKAAGELMPYVEQKLPIAFEDVSDRPRPVIVIGEVSERQQRSIDARLGVRVRREENQQVSAAEPATSDEHIVGQAVKPLSDQGNPK